MLEILFVVAFLIPVIPLVISVLSVRIIAKRKLTPSMFGYLGLFYFIVLVVGMMIGLTTILIGSDDHGDFLPPSVFLKCPATLAMFLSFLCAMVLSVRVYFRERIDKGRQRKLLILVLLANAVATPILLVPIPSIAVAPLEDWCNAQNRLTGERVVAAMESYRHDYGIYPSQIEDLVPRYFLTTPEDHCDPFDMREYRVKECSSGMTLLTIETMMRDRYQRYNLQTEIWSESPLPVGDWLEVGKWDFVCDDLE